MKTLKEIKQKCKEAKINIFCEMPDSTIEFDESTIKQLYFTKSTHADKAILLFEKMGVKVKEVFGNKRNPKPANSYFKYLVVVELPREIQE